MALCFSLGEYACPIWSRSAHTKKVDIPLNEATRLITGCLRPTPVPKLYITSGIRYMSFIDHTKRRRNDVWLK